MIEFLHIIANMLVTGSAIGLLFTFTLIMRGIARRERDELADLRERGTNHE